MMPFVFFSVIEVGGHKRREKTGQIFAEYFSMERLIAFGCFQKYGKTPQIIHFNRVWNHYKPSILGGKIPLFLVQHPF